MKIRKILDITQGEIKTISLSLVEEGSTNRIPVNDKNIIVGITGLQRDVLLFEYDDSNSLIIDKNAGCSNEFNLTLPEEAVSNPGEFFLEVHLFSNEFSRKFLFTYVVRQSVVFLPSGLPPIPPPNTNYKRFSYLSPVPQTQHIVIHNMESYTPFIVINEWDEINNAPGPYVLTEVRPNPADPINSIIVETSQPTVLHITLVAL